MSDGTDLILKAKECRRENMRRLKEVRNVEDLVRVRIQAVNPQQSEKVRDQEITHIMDRSKAAGAEINAYALSDEEPSDDEPVDVSADPIKVLK